MSNEFKRTEMTIEKVHNDIESNLHQLFARIPSQKPDDDTNKLKALVYLRVRELKELALAAMCEPEPE